MSFSVDTTGVSGPSHQTGPQSFEPDPVHAGGLIGQVIDLRRLYMMFVRRMRLFFAVAIAVFLAVVVFTVVATPKYTAVASVMLDPRKEQVTDMTAVLSGLPPDSSVVDTEVEVLRSRHLAERVVTDLKLDQDPEFNPALARPGPVTAIKDGILSLLGTSDDAEEAPGGVKAQKAHEKVVDSVLKGLSIKRAGLTYVINVAFASTSPSKAATIANAFASKYLLEQLEAKYDATKQANQWLNDRLGDLKGQVETAEAAVQNYKIQHNLLSAGATTLTESEISNYNQQVAAAKAQQAEDEATLQAAQQQLAKGGGGEDVGAALDSPTIQALRAQRAAASSKVADMAGRYGARHPEMLKAQRELADVDSQIQDEVKRIISSLRAKAAASGERTSSLMTSASGAKGTLVQNSQASVALNDLQRQADAVSTLYQSFLDRFKQTSAQQGIEQSDARVVSQARIPTAQSSPKVLLNMALGLVLAVGAGLALIIVIEMLDTGLTTADDVERSLDVPHLASLPLLASVADEKRLPSPVQYIIDKPLSSFAESFRTLRAALRYARVGVPVKIVAITSSLPGEGKTTAAVCLGRSAAQSGDRVVIVDCDLRRRNINRMIGTESERGLLEFLNGQAQLQDVLFLDRESGAYILPLAKSSFTPRDVFGTPAMDGLLQRLRENFDLVILDTAPTLAVADTRVLASKADAVVFLARWRKTPLKAVETSMKQLVASGAHIAGVALTQVDMKQQARYGYGDPGYYYTHYKKYYA